MPSPIEPGLDPLVRLAVTDLAQRLSLPADKIHVVEAKAVVWPNPGLGCPRPGMAYKQVPQDGSLIRLEVDGREYAYHGGGNRAPFLCEQAARKSKVLQGNIEDFVPAPDSADD